MKITVLHGDNELASRERLFKLKQALAEKGWTQIRLLPNSKQSIIDQLSAQALYKSKNYYFLDCLSLFDASVFRWLKKNEQTLEISLLVWHKKELGARLKNQFPTLTKFEQFALPKLLFKFLESFYPKNSVNCLKLLKKVLADTPTEFLVAMLSSHLRDLYWVLQAEGPDYPSWRLDRLKNQAHKYGKPKLKKIIALLAKADAQAKLGKTDLSRELDFLIICGLK